jgi:hypothetical protein
VSRDFYGEPRHVKRARKSRKCSWCGQQVDVGSEAYTWLAVDGSTSMTITLHPECYEDFSALEHIDTWTLYDNPRPERAANQQEPNP